jgi:hypothetical protein
MGRASAVREARGTLERVSGQWIRLSLERWAYRQCWALRASGLP